MILHKSLIKYNTNLQEPAITGANNPEVLAAF